MPKEKVFVVIGLGFFGQKICEVLSAKGGKVIALDNRPEMIERVREYVSQAVLIDATDEESLTTVPFENADIAIVAIGDNIEASIITTAQLKRIGLPYIVARAVKPIHRQVLLQVGADEVINIEEDEGERLASKLIAPEILDRIPISETISIAEVYAPKSFVGSSLQSLDMRNKLNLNVVAIRRIVLDVDETGENKRDEKIIFPSGTEELRSSDVLILAGKNQDIENLRRIE